MNNLVPPEPNPVSVELSDSGDQIGVSIVNHGVSQVWLSPRQAHQVMIALRAQVNQAARRMRD